MYVHYFRKLPTFLKARSLASKELVYYYEFKAKQYYKVDEVAHSFYSCMKYLSIASVGVSYGYMRMWVELAARYYVKAIKNGGKTK